MNEMTVSTKITVTKMTVTHHQNYGYLKNNEMTIFLIQKYNGHFGFEQLKLFVFKFIIIGHFDLDKFAKFNLV